MADFKLSLRLAAERDRMASLLIKINPSIGNYETACVSVYKDGFNDAAKILTREVIGPMAETLQFYADCPAEAPLEPSVNGGEVQKLGTRATEVLDRTKEWTE